MGFLSDIGTFVMNKIKEHNKLYRDTQERASYMSDSEIMRRERAAGLTEKTAYYKELKNRGHDLKELKDSGKIRGY